MSHTIVKKFRKCTVCGKEYLPRQSNSTCCSNICKGRKYRQTAKKKRNKATLIKKK